VSVEAARGGGQPISAGALKTLLSRTLFISLRNAAILSAGTPIVGCPTRFAVNDKLMGASTGVPACRRFARRPTKDSSVVAGVVGIRGRTRGIGSGGGGGGGGYPVVGPAACAALQKSD
jgi:hypothetical protein